MLLSTISERPYEDVENTYDDNNENVLDEFLK